MEGRGRRRLAAGLAPPGPPLLPRRQQARSLLPFQLEEGPPHRDHSQQGQGQVARQRSARLCGERVGSGWAAGGCKGTRSSVQRCVGGMLDT